MNSVKIEQFIDSLDVKTPPKEKFLELTHIFPISPQLNFAKQIPNYERGILLYSLIAKYKPKNVLEIGTAEGYSTLCMAWAMTDYNINGKIFTIDPKPFDVPIERNVTWEDNPKHDTVMLSRRELWNKFADNEWIKKIEVLTGFSGEVLQKNTELPKMDMGFIDGSHVYEAVVHDFYAFLEVASESFHLLFDDYVPNENDGVTKAIDEEVAPNVDIALIQTNAKEQRKESGELPDELYRCWLDSK